MNAKKEVLKLLDNERQANPQAVFPIVSVEAIENCEARLGLKFPSQYREFLTFCNGAEVGEEALYGVKPAKDYFDIERRFVGSPQFKEWNMLPIAGDGCGNYYLLDASSAEEGCVYFLDTISHDQPGYIVASDFWHFSYFYTNEKTERLGWPTDRDYVLRIDPGLANPGKAPPIWDT